MRKFKFGAGFTVFILFFGIALVEAFRLKYWPEVVFWLFMGVIFLAFDNYRQREKNNEDSLVD